MKIPDYIPKGTQEEIKKELEKWVGKEIIRGPTWVWEHQDEDCGGNRTEGIVLYITNNFPRIKDFPGVRVEWGNGREELCRVGNEFADVILVNPEEVYGKKYLNIEELKDACNTGKKVEFTSEFLKVSKENNWNKNLSFEPPFDILNSSSTPSKDGFYTIHLKTVGGETFIIYLKPTGKSKTDDIGMFKLYEEEKKEEAKEYLTYLNLDGLKECFKNKSPVYFTKRAFEGGFCLEKDIGCPVEISRIDGHIIIFTCNNRKDHWVANNSGVVKDDVYLFQSIPDKDCVGKEKTYLGKAYKKAGVQVGDKVSIYGGYEGVVVSVDEAQTVNKNISGDVDEWVYCRVEKRIKGDHPGDFKIGHISGWGYISVRKIEMEEEKEEEKQEEVKQEESINQKEEVNQQESINQKEEVKQEETKKESTMKEQVMSGLKALTEEGKEGFKSGAGAVGADEIVRLFHKHFDSKLPSWWGSVPMMKDLEATLVPGLLFLVATFADNKYAKKAEKLCLSAFRGKVHDLTKHLWADVRPLFEELSSLLEDE